MKKLFFLLLVLNLRGAVAQNVATLLTQMPDSLLPLITTSARDALVHGYGSVAGLQVKDEMGTLIQLDTLTEDFLRLATSESSCLEMRLIDATGVDEDAIQLVAVVETVKGPMADSRVRFFDRQWKQVLWLQLPEPSLSDYFPGVPDSLSQQMEQVVRVLEEMPTTQVEMDIAEPVFTLSIGLDELDMEQKKLASQWARPVRFRWDGREFQLVEP